MSLGRVLNQWMIVTCSFVIVFLFLYSFVLWHSSVRNDQSKGKRDNWWQLSCSSNQMNCCLHITLDLERQPMWSCSNSNVIWLFSHSHVSFILALFGRRILRVDMITNWFDFSIVSVCRYDNAIPFDIVSVPLFFCESLFVSLNSLTVETLNVYNVWHFWYVIKWIPIWISRSIQLEIEAFNIAKHKLIEPTLLHTMQQAHTRKNDFCGQFFNRCIVCCVSVFVDCRAFNRIKIVN